MKAEPKVDRAFYGFEIERNLPKSTRRDPWLNSFEKKLKEFCRKFSSEIRHRSTVFLHRQSRKDPPGS
ncbi:unnamed protein product [Caenorhabditis auriculariae]|uniref:Uncharacterized protein n=1 Tax=Caenorhabditis auriculariae TaxID=2777116 RepID=A0A8S1HNM6_9PELO|nr:unnamed protein product [Caenorhabditis auriculariae]